MDQNEIDKRMQRAEELMPQLADIMARIKDEHSPILDLCRIMRGDKNTRDRCVAAVQAMRKIRNNGEDYIAYGSLLRRICDLLEPTFEDDV